MRFGLILPPVDFSRRQPEPGRKVASVLEQRRIRNERRKRCRTNQPDTGNGCKALALSIGFAPSHELLPDGGELNIDGRDRAEKAFQRAARDVRECVRGGFAHDLCKIGQFADPLGGHSALK